MPRYMDERAMTISGEMLSMFWKRPPREIKEMIYRTRPFSVAQLNDGSWWMLVRSDSSIVFWMQVWIEIPKAVGERVQKVWEYAKGV